MLKTKKRESCLIANVFLYSAVGVSVGVPLLLIIIAMVLLRQWNRRRDKNMDNAESQTRCGTPKSIDEPPDSFASIPDNSPYQLPMTNLEARNSGNIEDVELPVPSLPTTFSSEHIYQSMSMANLEARHGDKTENSEFPDDPSSALPPTFSTDHIYQGVEGEERKTAEDNQDASEQCSSSSDESSVLNISFYVSEPQLPTRANDADSTSSDESTNYK